MKNKRKPYPLVGFIPTEEYIEDFKKIGFEYIEENDRCVYFKHIDGSTLYYYPKGKVFNHIYKFDYYKDLIKKIYDLNHFFKSIGIKSLLFYKKKSKERYNSKFYKRRIGKVRPCLLKEGRFLCNFINKKGFASCYIEKEYGYYFISIFIHNKK